MSWGNPLKRYQAWKERRRRKAVIAAEKTDYQRWSTGKGWASAWEGRARLAGELILPGSLVLDLGCGEMTLEAHLPDNCKYVPSDCVPRDARTVVCDFNCSPPVIDAATDIVCVLGLLEYLFDAPKFMRALSASEKRVILSYCPTDLTVGFDRGERGWVNGYSLSELEQMFHEVGFNFGSKKQI